MGETGLSWVRGGVVADLLNEERHHTGEVRQDLVARERRIGERGGLLGDDLGDSTRLRIEEVAQELIGGLRPDRREGQRGPREVAHVQLFAGECPEAVDGPLGGLRADAALLDMRQPGGA